MRDTRKMRQLIAIAVASGIVAAIGEVYIRPAVMKRVK